MTSGLLSAKSTWNSTRPSQRNGGVVGIGNHPPAAVEQILADAQQQRPQDGLFTREMSVDRRPADAGRGAQDLKGHAVEAVDGEQRGGGGQQRLAAVLLGLAALGGGGSGVGGRTAAGGAAVWFVWLGRSPAHSSL